MKIPAPPHVTKELLQKALERVQEPGVLDAVFRENTRYVHWEEIYRRKKYPVDPVLIWALMKFYRRKDARLIPFADTTFRYVLDGQCWEELHVLDKTAPDTLSRILCPPVTGSLTGKAGQGSNPDPEIPGALPGPVKPGGSPDSMASRGWISHDGSDLDQYVANAMMEEAIASARLAGADISRRVAKEMLREQRKPRTHDERMVLNCYRTMKEVRTMTGSDLTPDFILRLHAMITAGTLEEPDDELRFRENDDSRVTDSSGTALFIPPSYKEIPRLIDELCLFVNNDQDEFIHPVVKGIILHFLFSWIHPFSTGNGRCARALFLWYVAKRDYPLFEYLAVSRAIRDTSGQYRKSCLYTRSDENDLTYFIRYNLGIISNAIRETEVYIREKQEEQREVLEPVRGCGGLTIRQADILRQFMKHPEKPFRTREIMEVYKIASATARNDLSYLTDLGFIRKEKSGKYLVYMFGGIKGKE